MSSSLSLSEKSKFLRFLETDSFLLGVFLAFAGVFFVDADLTVDFGGFGVEVVILVGVFDRPRVVEVFDRPLVVGAFFFVGSLFAGADFTIGVDTRDGVRLRERRDTFKGKRVKLELVFDFYKC